MKFWDTILGKLLKFIAILVVSYFAAAIIGVIFLPTDDSTGTIASQYDGVVFFIAVVITLVTIIITDYNDVQRLFNRIKKNEKDIEYVQEMRDSLITKAEKIKDKYLETEEETFRRVAKSHNMGRGTIRNSKDFKAIVESFPEFKANEHTQKLLGQLEECEGMLLNAKTIYSSEVSRYNTKITTFPGVLLKKIFRWEVIDIKSTSKLSKENIISDEELGI